MNTNKSMKKKQIPFTYDVCTVLKKLKKYYDAKSLRVVRVNDEGGIDVACRGHHLGVTAEVLAKVFGGVGGYYDSHGYVKPRVEVLREGDGKSVTGIRVWKELLTWNEFCVAMRIHNQGFADKGNPEVWKGVVVYSPSASDWKRYLWDCAFEDRAYECHSTGEIFLEEDPSSGMCRHAHCVMTSLRGDSMHGGETLLRPDYSWVVDYCYIVDGE